MIFNNLYSYDSSYTVKVHFLYGSKPARGHKKTEAKWFGGLHGGHVSLEIDNSIYGFLPSNKFHVLARKKNRHSVYLQEPLAPWARDTAGEQYLTVELQLTAEQYTQLKEIHATYTANTPYDYAFLGMRCASATYDILSQLGIFKKHSRSGIILRNFYPKPLRKKMIRMSESKKLKTYFHAGVKTRKWEKD